MMVYGPVGSMQTINNMLEMMIQGLQRWRDWQGYSP